MHRCCEFETADLSKEVMPPVVKTGNIRRGTTAVDIMIYTSTLHTYVCIEHSKFCGDDMCL